MPTEKNITLIDEVILEQVFKEYFQPLVHYALQYVKDVDTSKDIVQKFFIYLWEKRESIDPNKSFKSLLYTSIRNRCLNYIRDHKKYRSKVLDIDCADIILPFEDESESRKTIEKDIQKALESLPEKSRQVFELSRFEGKKYREIAVSLDISEKTVESHMARALRGMREALKHYLPVTVLLSSMLWIANKL